MSDTNAAKREKIEWMIEQQRKFVEYERANGITGKDFFAPDDSEMGQFISAYREQYHDTAVSVIDMAHEVKSSRR
ncbi:MAG: hypothetical protein ACPGU7_09435 [Gammaproteobacteria bacterium]